MLLNLSDLDFDLSKLIMVKCDSAFELDIYGFLAVFNSNIRLNAALLRAIMFQNLSDLDIDLSTSLRSKVIKPIDL